MMKIKSIAIALVSLAMTGCGDGEGPDVTAEQETGNPINALNGRWGLTGTACNPDNTARDGVIVIEGADIQVGQEQCAVQSADPVEDHVWRLSAICRPAHGGEVQLTNFEAAIETEDHLRWTNMMLERTETYVRCPASLDDPHD